MRILILLITLLLPSVIMADVFTPPPTDKSVDFLGYIFGPALGSVYLGGTANPALLHMFERFNAVIITLGTLIVGYIAVVSTVNTAQEGQVMGRKYNSVWIPLRSAIGMLMLVPIPSSGYSIIQASVMWCILQGIGLADNIWNGVLNDFSHGASITQGITRPAGDNHAARIHDALELIGADLAESLLRSAVCMQTIHKMFYGTAIEPIGGFRTPQDSNVSTIGNRVHIYEVVHNNNTASAKQASYSGTLRIGIPDETEFNAVCGQYSVTGTANIADWEPKQHIAEDDLLEKAQEIYKHKIWALQLIFHNFLNIANKIVDENVTPRDEHNRLIALPEELIEPGGFRSEAINTYREILKLQIKPQKIQNIQSIVREGKANGWLSAGSFYFVLNQTQPIEFFSDIIVPPTTQLIPNCDTPGICNIYSPERPNILHSQLRDFLQFGPEISYMGTRLWDAKVYLDHDFTMISDRLSLKTKDAAAPTPLQTLQTNMLNLLHDMMHEQHNDPLVAQGRFGASIMLLSERSWLDIQNELQTTISRAEQGYTAITQELMQRIQNLTHRGALAIAIYSIVWIIGAILAIYVPLVPYLIFTIGVVGWFLLVIEAIVAAPILAISFMLPSNDEMGKVTQGLLLLLNILLRPIMMLFGFILATRLYHAVVKLVNFGMLANFHSLNTAESLFAWVAVLMLYATFIIALSNKCFSLIYGLPDKLLRWMGGVPEHSDPSQELQMSKSSIMKAGDTVNKVSQGMPERTLARLHDRAKQLAPPDAVSS